MLEQIWDARTGTAMEKIRNDAIEGSDGKNNNTKRILNPTKQRATNGNERENVLLVPFLDFVFFFFPFGRRRTLSFIRRPLNGVGKRHENPWRPKKKKQPKETRGGRGRFAGRGRGKRGRGGQGRERNIGKAGGDGEEKWRGKVVAEPIAVVSIHSGLGGGPGKWLSVLVFFVFRYLFPFPMSYGWLEPLARVGAVRERCVLV